MGYSLGQCCGRWILICVTAILVTGCATAENAQDPLEGFNRAMFGLNEGVDHVVLRPVAKGYEAALPSPVRSGVSNFFSNIGDVMIGVNNLLQGKPSDAGSDGMRFLVNTTFGVLGIFDVATYVGLEKHEEDFGQTFGRWGVGDGAYLVVPVFGPRTTRDAVGLVFDVATDPLVYVETHTARNVLMATRLVSGRAALLKADQLIEEAALDKYSYIRDAYLQRRRSLIYDGAPPLLQEDEQAQQADVKSIVKTEADSGSLLAATYVEQ